MFSSYAVWGIPSYVSYLRGDEHAKLGQGLSLKNSLIEKPFFLWFDFPERVMLLKIINIYQVLNLMQIHNYSFFNLNYIRFVLFLIKVNILSNI